MNETVPTPERKRAKSESSTERGTFLSVRSILNRTLDVVRYVRLQLQQLEIDDERTRLFVAALINQRSALEYAIDQCVLAAPRSTTDTVVQYADNPADAAVEPPSRHTPDDLVRWQNAVDDALVRGLTAVAERVENPEAAEILRGLTQLLSEHTRRTAFRLQEQRDV